MKTKKRNLYADVKTILIHARENAVRSVNFSMVVCYWKIGERIVQEELSGKARAGYGEKIIAQLSEKLTRDFGKGFTISNIKYMRQFYSIFPIGHALRGQLTGRKKQSGIGHALRGQSGRSIVKSNSGKSSLALNNPLHQFTATLRHELSWTHYRLLIQVEKEDARHYYMNEAADNNWSTRVLERQINSFYYERILSSKKRKQLQLQTNKKAKTDSRSVFDFVKDPYVLEFLQLKPSAVLYEKELETELLNKLQQFLLEMGKGFSFVERQQRISADGEDFYIDLVFYNYVLKCFVLIDLKTGKLTHQDIGQMDFYMRYYESEIKQPSDNPTVGIILCAEKNETIVKYSILNENKRLFASKYKLYLPSETDLANELKEEIAQYNRKRNK